MAVSSVCCGMQAGLDDPVRNVLCELLVHCAHRDAFHVLRTQQQLGYLVHLTTWWTLSVRRYVTR